MGWLYKGTTWEGNIVLVSLTDNLKSLVESALADTLFLLLTGTHGPYSKITMTRNIKYCFRGLGDDADDTIISFALSTTHPDENSLYPVAGEMFLENLKVSGNIVPIRYSCSSHGEVYTAANSITINKSHIYADSMCIGTGHPVVTGTTLRINNTYLENGGNAFYHVAYLDNPKSYFSKVSYNNTWRTYENTGGLGNYPQEDVAAEGTSGYGYNYGDYLLIREGPPIMTTQAATDVSGKTLTANGTILNTQTDAPTRRGFCLKEGTSGTPTLTDTVIAQSGSFSVGPYSLAASGLKYNTSYRLCSFAENSEGVGYGNVVDVQTLQGAAEVSTQDATAVSTTTATLNGTIDNPGGTSCTRRGFCMKEGSSGTPTLTDTVIAQSGSFSAGTYALPVNTVLTAETAYRVRAFAENSAGIGYGEPITLTTQAYADPIRVCPRCRGVFLDDRVMMIDETRCPHCGAPMA